MNLETILYKDSYLNIVNAKKNNKLLILMILESKLYKDSYLINVNAKKSKIS